MSNKILTGKVVIRSWVVVLLLTAVATMSATGTQDGGPATASLGGVSVQDGVAPGCLFWTVSNVTVNDSLVQVSMTVTNGFTQQGNRATVRLSVPGAQDDNETIIALSPRNQIPMDTQVTLPSGQLTTATIEVQTFNAANQLVCNDSKTVTIDHPAVTPTPLPPGTSISDDALVAPFDTNQNQVIDTPEFFDAIRDFNAGLVEAQAFFAVFRFWNSQDLILTDSQPPDQPPTDLPPDSSNCPGPNFAVIPTLNGVEISRNLEIQGDTQIGLGFNQPNPSFPPGTDFNVNVRSQSPLVQLTPGGFVQPFSGEQIPTGPQTLQIVGFFEFGGNGPVQVPTREWTTFRVNPLPGPPGNNQFGIQINSTISAPGCPMINNNFTINGRILQAASSGTTLSLFTLRRIPQGLLFNSQNSSPIQVELLNGAGARVFESDFGHALLVPTLSVHQQAHVANGIYFAVVRTRDAGGQIYVAAIRKISILR